MTSSRPLPRLLSRAGRSTTAMLGAALVSIAVLASLGVRAADAPDDTETRPADMPLVRSDLVCPPFTRPGAVVSLNGHPGSIERWVPGGGSRTLDLDARGVAALPPDDRATVLSGRDDLAPGLAAGGAGEGSRGLAAAPCQEPTQDAWFVGVGARGEVASTLRLVNPDPGPATVDVTFWARSGEVVVPRLRGIRVPGRSEQVHDLARIVPRRGLMAMRVEVSRGRAAPLVSTTWDPIGPGPVRSEWLAPSAAPVAQGWLLGLSGRSGAHHLHLLNPSVDEVRVRLRVVTDSSTFAPVGLEEVRVPAGSMAQVDLTSPLGRAVRDGALGLVLDATVPIVATLASEAGGDPVVQPLAEPLDGTGVAVLPAGEARLLLTGATSRTPVQVEFRDRSGRQVGSERVAVSPGSGRSVPVPRGAGVVLVTGEAVGLVARVLVQGTDGVTAVDVVSPPMRSLAPSVSRRSLTQR